MSTSQTLVVNLIPGLCFKRVDCASFVNMVDSVGLLELDLLRNDEYVKINRQVRV